MPAFIYCFMTDGLLCLILGSSSSDFGSLQCRFCPGVEKLFVTDRRTVGLRKDLNGVLLLDSILQAPVAEDCDAPITLELTLADVSRLNIKTRYENLIF